MLDSPYGYVTQQFSMFKTKFTEKSDLYLIKTSFQITPGCVAVMNGLNYDDCFLNSGFIHQLITPLNQPWRHSADMSLIGAFPLSNSVTTTYTSVFGVTPSLNNQFTSGVSIGNGLQLKLDRTIGAGLSLAFTKGVSSTTGDPLLSQQYTPTNSNESQWSFYVLALETAGRVTYNLDTYELVEIARNGSNCSNYAMDIRVKVQISGTYEGRLLVNTSDLVTRTNNIGY